MTLWIVLTLLVAASVAVLTIPLVRRWEERPGGEAATRAVLTDQLAEIDKAERGGSVSAIEADAMRLEAKRRLLVEGRADDRVARPLGASSLGQIAVAVAILVTLGGTLLYSRLGSPESVVAAVPDTPADAAGGTTATAAADASVTRMVATLEARLKTKPDDVEGWRMLGWARYSLGQFGPAAHAYTHAVALAPGRADLQSALGEALTLTAQGTVTPDAKTAFGHAVATDPSDPRARYFLGVARDQAGDHKGAIAAWVALLNSAPPGAPWADAVRTTLTRTAAQAGVSLAGRLTPAAVAGGTPTVPAPATVAPAPLGPGLASAAGAIPQPSAAQVAQVQALTPDQRQAMIRSMVDGLAARLKTNPQDPDGWLRLIRARMVLGDAPAAAAARAEALAAITNPGQRQAVSEGAKALGVPGA